MGKIIQFQLTSALPVPVAPCVWSPCPLLVCPVEAAGRRPGWASGAAVWSTAAQPPPAGIPQLPVHPAGAGQHPERAMTGSPPSARSPSTSPKSTSTVLFLFSAVSKCFDISLTKRHFTATILGRRWGNYGEGAENNNLILFWDTVSGQEMKKSRVLRINKCSISC